jgi:recombination protein RecR
LKLSSPLLEQAVEAFATLPGIGRRTALRLVLHLLQKDPEATAKLVEPIARMRAQLQFCTTCGYVSEEAQCAICLDKRRDAGLVCVVESIRDVMAIEDTGLFNGRYHVLGGLIHPLNGVGPEDIGIDTLLSRKHDLREVVLAISPTIEGETTMFFIADKLKELGVVVTTLARGVAFGGELEYTDEITLGRSIAARQPYRAGF